MRAVILCPGRSLHASLREYNLDLAHRVLVVNAARDEVPKHDWLIAGDFAAMGWSVDERTRLGLCSVGDSKRPAGVDWKGWADLPLPVDPTGYSSVAALSLALAIGCTEVDVLGADMAGDIYISGESFPALSDPARWDIERVAWAEMAERVRATGVRVERLGQPIHDGAGTQAT